MGRRPMSTPLLSVIVPVWNTARFLPECLDSLVNQTLRDIEIICVNDASTDESVQILERYAALDPRIRVFSQERNRGPGATRNLGINQAQGDYIGFVDSDDRISSNFYLNLYQAAVSHNADITITRCTVYDDSTTSTVFGSSINIFATLKQRWVHNVRGMIKSFGPTWYENRDLSDKRVALSAFPSVVDKLYRRSLFDQVRFPEEVLFEDMLFMPQIMYHASRIFSCPDGMYYYRRNADSITRRRDFSSLVQKLIVAGILDQWVQHLMLSGSERKAYEALVARKYRQAVKGLAKHVSYWPPERIKLIKNQSPSTVFLIFIKALATRLFLICLIATMVVLFINFITRYQKPLWLN
jgi:glycosyltransferase involved in cell wall biosynthesis